MSQPERIITKRVDMVDELTCVRDEVTTAYTNLLRATVSFARSLARLDEIIIAVAPRPLATETASNSAARTAPAAQAASPQVHAPVAQDEGQPESARKASDDRSVGVSGKGTSDQSEELRHVAGAGGESAASADTAPAADAKPKRTFPQPMPDKAPDLPLARPTAEIHKQPPYKASGPAATDPMVPRREPQVLRAGGGLVQDGGSKLGRPPAPAGANPVKEQVLDLYAEAALSNGEIAETTGAPTGSVKSWLSLGRGSDPRVIAGDRKRADRLTRTASPPAAASPAPKPVEIPSTLPLIVIGKTICGPDGQWEADKQVAKIIGLLADGNLYGTDRMTQVSGIAENHILPSLGIWSAALAKIGVELVHTRGIGVKLNRRASA